MRGIARDKAKTIGNFWVDLVRLHLYLLIPICIVYALFLVSQGMIHELQAVHDDQRGRPEPPRPSGTPTARRSSQGPMASQIAIKMLGTNGGGYYQRQRRPSLRKPHAAVQLHPDAFDLRDPQRA